MSDPSTMSDDELFAAIQASYDSVKAERDALRERVAELEGGIREHREATEAAGAFTWDADGIPYQPRDRRLWSLLDTPHSQGECGHRCATCTPPGKEVLPVFDHDDAAHSEEDDPRQNDCCVRCREEWEADNTHLPAGVLLSRRMIVCPECGNKRCARADDHRARCWAGPRDEQEG